MSTPKVTIKHIEHKHGWESWDEVELYVDDVLIESGSYGGEPEDNSRYRTYTWVEPMLAKLAKALDVEVVTTTEVIQEDE